MSKVSQLHHFVKRNYERGNYDNAQASSANEHPDYDGRPEKPQIGVSDYQLGYKQALSDFENKHAFRHYPKLLVKFANIVSGHRLFEVLAFIVGYDDGKSACSKQG